MLILLLLLLFVNHNDDNNERDANLRQKEDFAMMTAGDDYFCLCLYSQSDRQIVPALSCHFSCNGKALVMIIIIVMMGWQQV